MPNFFALIPAAGSGSRMGDELPKQYLPLAGKPMIYHALKNIVRFFADRFRIRGPCTRR